jgi:hypothetical protein
MNAMRWGFVCLSLGLLLYCCGFLLRTPRDERAASTREQQSGSVPDMIRLRIRAKRLLVEELDSGRLTLFEAAALFRELDGMSPRTVYWTMPDPPIRLESPTEDEQACVRVITVARNVLSMAQPDRARIVTERLVAEFEAERCLSGAIRLPDPASLEPVEGLLRRCVQAGSPAPTTTTAPGDR